MVLLMNPFTFDKLYTYAPPCFFNAYYFGFLLFGNQKKSTLFIRSY